MIGYHYSPGTNRKSIAKHGLLVPTLHPKLTVPVVCSEGHRNPHISLAKTPGQAWELSGGFLYLRHFERGWNSSELECLPNDWDLWQVELGPNKTTQWPIRYWSNGYELQVRKDIPRTRLCYVGSRTLHLE